MYSYTVVDKYKSFTVRANGDLDCDGEYSTFELTATVGKNYQLPVNPTLWIQKEAE